MYKHIFSLLFSTTCLYIIASPAMMLIYDHSVLQEEEVKSPYLLDLNNKSSYMNWISISSFPSFVEFKFLTSMTFGTYLRGCHASFVIITYPLMPLLILYYHILFLATCITQVSKILFLVNAWSTDNLQGIDKSIYAVLLEWRRLNLMITLWEREIFPTLPLQPFCTSQAHIIIQ